MFDDTINFLSLSMSRTSRHIETIEYQLENSQKNKICMAYLAKITTVNNCQKSAVCKSEEIIPSLSKLPLIADDRLRPSEVETMATFFRFKSEGKYFLFWSLVTHFTFQYKQFRLLLLSSCNEMCLRKRNTIRVDVYFLDTVLCHKP